MTKIEEIKELVRELNYYRDLYYNHQISEISDYTYDEKYDRLVELEKETNFILFNSPTQTVGYEVKSELNKVKHNHPMLSLDKTKLVDDVMKFLDDRDGIIMAKMDGLTCSARYVNGKLVSAETRGNGEIGEDVLHCAKTIKNLPSHIDCKDEVIIDGEVIITYDDFEKINSKLPKDQQYKHPRNLASGSIRQLDSKIATERNMKFIAWKMIKGYEDNSFAVRLFHMDSWGFDIVPFIVLPKEITDKEKIEHSIILVKQWAKEESYPIDGCVFGYDNIAYGDSLGATGHHLRSQLAFKFYDDLYETTLRDVEWTMGKTSVLTPTAVFDSIEIDNTEVSRASIHNISILKNLGLTKNCTVRVYKANRIIPQIDSADQDGDSPIIIPKYCPICGGETKVMKENESEVLICTNDNCSGKLLGKLSFFASKKAMDIDGLSEATIEFLINKGWVKKYVDLYLLDQYADTWAKCDGFGKKSVENILAAIEKSRDVNLAHFITALSIPNIGSAASKTIAKYCHGDVYELFNLYFNDFNWTKLNDFGDTMAKNIEEYLYGHIADVEELADEMHFIVEEKKTDNSLDGLKFCITGTFGQSREEIKKKLESKGAKFISSVSKNLDVLFCGDKAGSKLVKAQQLGIKIADEKELIKIIGA